VQKSAILLLRSKKGWKFLKRFTLAYFGCSMTHSGGKAFRMGIVSFGYGFFSVVEGEFRGKSVSVPAAAAY
jgi:hypothetical protein